MQPFVVVWDIARLSELSKHVSSRGIGWPFVAEFHRRQYSHWEQSLPFPCYQFAQCALVSALSDPCLNSLLPWWHQLYKCSGEENKIIVNYLVYQEGRSIKSLLILQKQNMPQIHNFYRMYFSVDNYRTTLMVFMKSICIQLCLSLFLETKIELSLLSMRFLKLYSLLFWKKPHGDSILQPFFDWDIR